MVPSSSLTLSRTLHRFSLRRVFIRPDFSSSSSPSSLTPLMIARYILHDPITSSPAVHRFTTPPSHSCLYNLHFNSLFSTFCRSLPQRIFLWPTCILTFKRPSRAQGCPHSRCLTSVLFGMTFLFSFLGTSRSCDVAEHPWSGSKVGRPWTSGRASVRMVEGQESSRGPRASRLAPGAACLEVIDWESGCWVVNGTCSVVDICPRCSCVVCKLEDRDTIKMRRGAEVSLRVASSGRLQHHRPPPFPSIRTSPSRLNGPTPSLPLLVWTDINSAWRLTFSTRPLRARDGALLH